MSKEDKKLKYVSVLCVIILILLVCSGTVWSQSLPKVTLDFSAKAGKDNSVVVIQILFLITVLSLAPAILIMMTSFTRIIIVFHFLRI